VPVTGIPDGRQYTGTAGRIENCQVGVFTAGIGDGIAFATKPELARQMVERASQGGRAFLLGWPATRSMAATRSSAPGHEHWSLWRRRHQATARRHRFALNLAARQPEFALEIGILLRRSAL